MSKGVIAASAASENEQRNGFEEQVLVDLYLPEECGCEPQIRQGRGRWTTMKPDPTRTGFYAMQYRGGVGSEISVRYRNGAGFAIAPPLSGCENLNGRFFLAADSSDSGNGSALAPGHGRICLEFPLEGILAGYAGGRYAPGELQDLLKSSISQRLLNAEIPKRLAALAFDEVMAPVFASVADRSHLNPKFNYLTLAAGELDWQIGRQAEFRQLVSTFRQAGIELVPDMIFAHFVKRANSCALDSIVRKEDGHPLFADDAPTLFRDYGTWMYNLADPAIRAILVDKIVRFINDFGLKILRVDFVDGIIYQYSGRSINFGEVFIRDLAASLRNVHPAPLVIGEAFSTAGNSAVRELIDVAYCPRGFSIAEEIYRPPRERERPQYPNAANLVQCFKEAASSQGREAIYAQLHDETWRDEHIRAGRPFTPWAYGAHPAELALRAARELAELHLIGSRDLLETTRRLVRATESLTLFLARYRYLQTPAVDSLTLGGFDHALRWKMEWDDPAPCDVLAWRKTSLSETEIFRLHDQHRADMIELRSLWRRLTPIDETNQLPLCSLEVLGCDQRSATFAILRRRPGTRSGAHVVLWNLGPHAFIAADLFEIPVPMDLRGNWTVAFDGDRFRSDLLLPGQRPNGYPDAFCVSTGRGEVFPTDNILRVAIGPMSLLILTLAE